MKTFNSDFIRNQFPAFAQPSLFGWAFFENAGGSYPSRPVVERLRRFYEQTKVQPYGAYPASRDAGEAMDQAYTRLAGLLNVDAGEVHFGPSTSQNTYVLAHAFRGTWQAGDEIVVTNQDHEANSGAWRRLSASGIVVHEWQVNPQTGRLDCADLQPLLSDRTRLVAFPHCSNIVADINPVAEISAMAHTCGVRVVVDGVAYAPHGFPDVRGLDVDVYLFSLYKTFGPHQGLMVIRRELLDRLTPQCHFFNTSIPRKRMIPAGPDHAQIAAAVGVAEYFEAVYQHHCGEMRTDSELGRTVHDLFRAQETALLTPLLAWLRAREDVRIIGPDDAHQRAPTVSILPQHRPIADVMVELERHRIMAGSGHFYAVRLLQAMGIPPSPGVLRVSFLHYTTRAEVDQLIAALDQAL